jgi:hypothetical protein
MTKIRCGIQSDLHIEFDQALLERAQSAAASGQLSNKALAWWQHLCDRRNVMPSHPWEGPDLYDVKGVDLLLLAGDIGVGASMTMAYATEASRFCGCPVLLCLGNHELYDGVEIGKTLADMRDMAAKASGGARVHILENERADFVIRGRSIAVLGTALFTDYCLNGESQQAVAMDDAERALNDHRRIRYQGRRFRPQDALDLHLGARAWLASAISTARAADVLVVMTHHAPTPAANPPVHRGGKLSPAFASDMEAEIRNSGADLWLSGHSHWNHDLMIGRTRCVSHQRGYVGADPEDGMPPAEEFAPLIIEMDLL